VDANLHPRSPCNFRCVRRTDKVLWSTGLLAAVGHSVRVSVDVALVTLTCAVLMGLQGRFGQLYLNLQAQSVRLGCWCPAVLVSSISDCGALKPAMWQRMYEKHKSDRMKQ